MKILLTGADGFIGRRLQAELLARGHDLLCLSRRPPQPLGPTGRCRRVQWDLAAPPPPAAAWHALLNGVDVVINAAGVFRASAQQFDAVHRRGPVALFEACVAAGVPRVVQISALGADAQAVTAYHRSKLAADDALLALPLHATVLQPSLVFGEEGRSSRWFMCLAALPVLPLPAGGRQSVQPLHVEDLVLALCALLQAPHGSNSGRRIALVGPQPMSLAAYLRALRAGLGLPPAPAVTLPAALVAQAAMLGDHVPGALLNSAAWQMLQRGNTAPAEDVRALLQRPPRPASSFVTQAQAPLLRLRAQMDGLLPLLRVSLAVVWILSGMVSMGLYPVEDSRQLLARTGVPEPLQPLALYGAATLDLLLGMLTLLRPRAALWRIQAAVIIGYTALLSARLPEFWLHPFGPLSKNLPMLALLALLWTLDRRPHGTA